MEPFTLYTGPSSTSTAISLLDNITNYDYLYIEYFQEAKTSHHKATIIRTDNGEAVLDITLADNSSITFYSVKVTFSGQSLSFGTGRGIAFSSSGAFNGWASSNQIKISSIVGLKRIGS